MRKESRESMALTALAEEAKRRGITYGRLVASTNREEQEEIIGRYREKRKKKGRKKKT